MTNEKIILLIKPIILCYHGHIPISAACIYTAVKVPGSSSLGLFWSLVVWLFAALLNSDLKLFPPLLREEHPRDIRITAVLRASLIHPFVSSGRQ